ncbi:DNA repair protein XRCC4-like isoform X2 [Mizuhopecten yessoensis]|uniref:DNA repair protein XRCC4 n=2 Tax=Mizuhopecten yessoensis TaxID=6573 RepID=A0A210QPK7_MIZYE|nr:DNA repair protein XRCC4-like isoform X2 [Mizuhopecten yessoensis]XP_021353059.1 DNA repair protein XRCC4-like isoform X2 [Mizuhopecten yessoensis]XP_021353060.1 DNA repair protein XRCC4-like isoform X2 [Mizuhopecten yessoensis]OWF50651.1 DNA repair protein XRCC4 [Mizuhopecten yessoensis]
MERKTFVKLDLNEDKQYYLLTTLVDEDQYYCIFKLTLSDGLKVWMGQVTQINFGDSTQKSKKYLQEYQRQTVEAFTGETFKDNEYRFTLKHQPNAVEFSWKRNVSSKEIAFLLGTTTLKLCSDEKSQDMITQIFQFCINQTTDFKDQISTLNIDNKNLAQERVNALKRLEKCVVAKEELEKDLYSKFAAVLNAKKEKIQRLKDQMETGAPTPVVSDSEEEPTASTSRTTVPSAKAARKRKASDESESNTSDEDMTTSQPCRLRIKGTKPSKADEDDGLVLEDSKDSVSRSEVIRRPRRPPGGNKKQTPSKPVLPRVPSDSSSSSGGNRRTSVRKSNSGRSNRSSDNVDIDDLLNDM